jgi:hypothetical protein
MSETIVGFVEKINETTGNNSRGPWTAYSMKIQDKDGTVNPKWFQAGFEKPVCVEGDYVQLKADPKDDKALTVVKGSIRVSKNPPAKPASPDRGEKRGKVGYSAAKTTSSDLFGEIGGYNTEDDIRRMSYSACRSDAVLLTAALIEAKALPMSKADSKAGVAARFEAVEAYVDKLTVRFFFDSASGRLLETVADAGDVDLAGDGDLPDADEGEESGDEFSDDFDGDDDDFE